MPSLNDPQLIWPNGFAHPTSLVGRMLAILWLGWAVGEAQPLSNPARAASGRWRLLGATY